MSTGLCDITKNEGLLDGTCAPCAMDGTQYSDGNNCQPCPEDAGCGQYGFCEGDAGGNYYCAQDDILKTWYSQKCCSGTAFFFGFGCNSTGGCSPTWVFYVIVIIIPIIILLILIYFGLRKIEASKEASILAYRTTVP